MRNDIAKELGADLIQQIMKEVSEKKLTLKDFYSLGERRIYQARHIYANSKLSAKKIKELRLIRIREIHQIHRHHSAIQARKAVNALPNHSFSQNIKFKLYTLNLAWCLSVVALIVIMNSKPSAVLILFALVFQYWFDFLNEDGDK